MSCVCVYNNWTDAAPYKRVAYVDSESEVMMTRRERGSWPTGGEMVKEVFGAL
jgi:hypothetical protein